MKGHGINKSNGLVRVAALFCFLLSLSVVLSAQETTNPDPYYRHVVGRITRLDKHKLITTTVIGQSKQGRPIYAVTLTHPGKTETICRDRIRIIVMSGQHGDEPLPVHTTLEYLEACVKGSHAQFLGEITVVFIPVVNPDGFVAGTRSNNSGVDLNRDWQKCSQPETYAVTKFIKEVRPQVLIDQHEWVKDDPYRPNCIETAEHGHKADKRLSRLLASQCIKTLKDNGASIRHAYYNQQSDGRMAHRKFTSLGISTILVETSPDLPDELRRTIYTGVLDTAFETLAFPANPVIKNDISVLKNRHAAVSDWTKKSYSDSNNDNTQLTCWIALLAAATIAIIKAAIPSKTQTSKTGSRMQINRPCPLTEIARFDLSTRAKLAIIQRYRPRPSDRAANPRVTSINR